MENDTVYQPSQLDYFAAHAPPGPQYWFYPKVNFQEWKNGYPQRDEDPVAQKVMFDEYRRKQRLVQWPWAWAKAVLEARNSPSRTQRKG